jgi:hypothetical protein
MCFNCPKFLVAASLAAKLTPEQLKQLEDHANKFHDSRKHIIEMEKVPTKLWRR